MMFQLVRAGIREEVANGNKVWLLLPWSNLSNHYRRRVGRLETELQEAWKRLVARSGSFEARERNRIHGNQNKLQRPF
jgi:hypothetical protein